MQQVVCVTDVTDVTDFSLNLLTCAHVRPRDGYMQITVTSVTSVTVASRLAGGGQ